MSKDIAGKLRALLERVYAQASNGLAFSTNAYELKRYKDILDALSGIAELFNGNGSAAVGTNVNWRSASSEIGTKEYVTPKIAVAAIVFNNDGHVLLVKRDYDLWTLPGGFADVGLDPARNVEREVKEETGLDVKAAALIGVYDSNLYDFPTLGRQIYTLAFYAKLLGGSLHPDPVETLGASFFSLYSLPNVPNVTSAQVDLARRVHLGGMISPFFDIDKYT
jgi:ADP-ribose pyrophosphatase YjhB (NUDIX family)